MLPFFLLCCKRSGSSLPSLPCLPFSFSLPSASCAWCANARVILMPFRVAKEKKRKEKDKEIVAWEDSGGNAVGSVVSRLPLPPAPSLRLGEKWSMVLCLSLAMVTSLECNWLELLRVGPAPRVSLSFSLSLFFSRSLSETRQEQGCLVRHAFLSLFFLVFCMDLNDNGTYCSCTSDWLNSLTLKIHSGFSVLQITLCFVPFCAQFWIGLWRLFS